MTETAEMDGRIVETPDPTPEERAIAEKAENDALRRIKEPLVYSLAGEHGYFADLAFAERHRDPGAIERRERHGKQMADLPKDTRELRGAEFEYRVDPSRAAGFGGEFAPPLWLNELFATAPRPGAVIQRLAPSFTLPPGCSSVNMPRITTGTVADIQPDNAPVADQNILTAQCASPAVAFAGMSDWSIQSLEQSPAGASLDWVVFKDLTEDLDYQIELQLLTGSGANGEWYGLLNLEGTNKIAFTEAVEVAKMFPYIGRLAAQAGVKRRLPPQAWLATTGRFMWLALSPDTEQRTLILTDNVGDEFPVASMAGIAVYLDDAIPNTLGAGSEDTILAIRPSDYVILATEPVANIINEPLSGTLQVRFALRRYVAAILGRYPQGVSYLTGSGMIPPTGYR